MEEFVDTYGRKRHIRDTLIARYKVRTKRRRIRTLDGIELDTLRMGEEPERAVIICHGFAGNKNSVNIVALAEDMSRFYTVYTFDFRGHGLSGGDSTFYYLEVLDLLAVVRRAIEDGNDKIGVIGFSMGGMVALRYAAIVGGLDSVIAVGVTGDIKKCRKPASMLLYLLLGNPLGRALVSWIYDIKVSRKWKEAAPPGDLMGLIYPQPLTIIQGKDDRFFSLEEAKELYSRAAGNARFKSYADFGHADEGYDHVLFKYLNSVLDEDFAGDGEAVKGEVM
ncbi:MAG: alpha/beta fold hydrolase [Actinobacteria bacterium]|nr:alpha/beta fold hydrolase [Actinomycetota bacterium]